MLGDGSDLIHFTGSYGAWTLLVGQYMEHSPALRNSAQCFIDCRRALSVPTDVNLAAVRSSNNDAIRSICAALDINSTRACSGDILIAVQILYVVEVSRFIPTREGSVTNGRLHLGCHAAQQQRLYKPC
jgi:hypothetical protein